MKVRLPERWVVPPAAVLWRSSLHMDVSYRFRIFLAPLVVLLCCSKPAQGMIDRIPPHNWTQTNWPRGRVQPGRKLMILPTGTLVVHSFTWQRCVSVFPRFTFFNCGFEHAHAPISARGKNHSSNTTFLLPVSNLLSQLLRAHSTELRNYIEKVQSIPELPFCPSVVQRR